MVSGKKPYGERSSSLVALVGVFTGGILAGIAGMFLSLPVIAVLKIIFDRTENFKQWGLLFGHERPQKKTYEGLLKLKGEKLKKEKR